MPNYDYRCHNCNVVWEQQTTIADRDVPVNEPCPVCEQTGNIERFLGGAPIWGREKGKVPETFKDVLRAVKKRNPGSVINTDGIS